MTSITRDKGYTDSSVDHEAESVGNIALESGDFRLEETVKSAVAPLEET